MEAREHGRRLKATKQSILIILALLIGLSGFYWFSIRSANIRKECGRIAAKAADGAYEEIEIPYTDQTVGFYNSPSRLVTRYKTERIDKTAETYAATYTLCTSQKGV